VGGGGERERERERKGEARHDRNKGRKEGRERDGREGGRREGGREEPTLGLARLMASSFSVMPVVLGGGGITEHESVHERRFRNKTS
jgi:hypothetical protein